MAIHPESDPKALAASGRKGGMTRGAVDADTLLRIVLVLVVVWVALEVLDVVVDLALGVLGLFRPLIGLIVLVLIVLYLLDRL